MHKGVGTIPIYHIHLQYEEHFACQHIEWPTSTPCIENLALMSTGYELC